MKLFVLLILILASLSPHGELAAKGGENSFVCPLSQIRFDDGDSFGCGEETIRILGIDTPEIRHEAHGIFEDQKFGRKAAAFTEKTLKTAEEIKIVRGGKDIYGRTLAHLLVDGKLLAIKLLMAGLAYENISIYGDNGLPRYAAEILEAAAKAPKPRFENPHTWRKKHQKKG